ncbi:DnaD domain protein [Butyrivibrio sp. INlla16]|uniref:DnaD domain protein n=1 Tax=Butyrivibrio sp. INlla16 TaxID=1520807 RepID=UPI000883F210|nr:DnaD domain protein [Butyrivibrio sp. INlla16]SDB36092.1 DnaD and phage-associated domain-containing protein [Butyrivibrio sp. INlla16]
MMGRVTINQNSMMSTTSLSNIFIDEYLADANDAQIKVYLYLLRMMCSGMATSVCDLADKFNYTEKDVQRALRYWEELGLISLELDGSGMLVGIHMQDIFPKKAAKITGLHSVRTPEHEAPSRYSVVKKTPEKKAHHKDNPQMLFVAEQYFGRTLNSSEIKTIYYIQDTLEFSEDLLDYLLQHCVGKGKTDFDYVRKVAMAWHEKGITSPEQAALEITATRTAYQIMKELGMQNAPTPTELQYFDRWQDEYGFSLTIITEACRRTVLQTQVKRVQYCDGILKSWFKAGVKALSDVKALDGAFGKETARKESSRKAEAVKTNNRFHQFKQNDYDLSSLENQLLDN